MICFCRIAAVRDQSYKITPNRDTANRGARFRMMMRISEKVECRPFHLSPPTRISTWKRRKSGSRAL
jgi:hypothetical protein